VIIVCTASIHGCLDRHVSSEASLCVMSQVTNRHRSALVDVTNFDLAGV
jgi:hypothetical protein